MKHDLRRADQVSDRHMGKTITIGDVTGTLTGLIPVANHITLVLIVGGARAFFALDRDAAVEVWREGAS
jgi:hypothetical protein